MSQKDRSLKGSYILIINLPESKTITIGSLRKIQFSSGSYAYIGSAMKGFHARLPHHLKRTTHPHWHIDYLLQYAQVTGILVSENDVKKECEIAQTLLSRFRYIPKFGCSDCKCKSHLVFLGERAGIIHDT